MDLDNDGYLDICTGAYDPGIITWYRGSAKGFLPAQVAPQEGVVNERRKFSSKDRTSTDCRSYALYSTMSFEDFNGDGLVDLLVGGAGGVRVSLNEGTKHSPKFGLRKDLLLTNGKPLYVPGSKDFTWKVRFSLVDWDGDGVKDVIKSGALHSDHDPLLDFHKGVKTKDGLRFKEGISLLKNDSHKKLLPGSETWPLIADYNNDGVKDIIITLSLPTVNGYNVDDFATWKYIYEMKIAGCGKDIGRQIKYVGQLDGVKDLRAFLQKSDEEKEAYLKTLPPLEERIKKDLTKKYSMVKAAMGILKDKKYYTLRHRGFVYVMYGKK